MQELTLTLLGLLTFLAVVYIGGIVKASRMEDVKERENYIKELDKIIADKEKMAKQGGDFTKWRRKSL